jgi:hypothetical protein
MDTIAEKSGNAKSERLALKHANSIRIASIVEGQRDGSMAQS